MSLKHLAGKAKVGRLDSPIVTVTVVADGEEIALRFRRPTRYDLIAAPPLRSKIDDACAGLPFILPMEVQLLASTYQPDPQEGAVDPVALFVAIARDNDLLFGEISARWSESFPEFGDWLAARMTAGNASAPGASAPSDDASGASPSGSGASPGNSPT